MPFLTIVYALLFYTATALLVGGLAYKIRQYAKTPAPLKIPTTPAPVTRAGVVLRMFRELVFFESLFKSNKWIWIFGYLFHFGMFLVLARHLRYFTNPVWTWVDLIQPFGLYAAFAMVAGLLGLWARRFLVDRIRYISALSDHLMLALLLAIALTGMSMDYLTHTDIVSVNLLSGSDVLQLATPARGSGIACPSGAGRHPDDHLPDQQAAACARRLFQSHPQPGRQPARAAASRAVGCQTGKPITRE
jgi:nitrate reductase gamma subunit